ncbi:hypothetical protein PHYBOEH_001073 [Phytophthora boehmeriae]|uniref:Temptin Cys/Cys disulfide domain-containing protein n=1 Tax=Phytophthora boehmeriae TaxID=109152 RepID=A0A8T1WVW5_9STRA|nr:hypothetical protein PHYBOEH_001073 [Phytophthora boehmeriae]
MRASSVVISVIMVGTVPQVSSYSMYAIRVPNGDKVPGVTALGHVDPVLAGPMNEFGMDMIDADFKWTKELCMKDSDGDGQTNGQELGDPCCEFVFRKNAVVRWSECISHPGDAEFTSDPALWEGLVCPEAAAEVAPDSLIASSSAASKVAVEGHAVTVKTQGSDGAKTQAVLGTTAKNDSNTQSMGPAVASSGEAEEATLKDTAAEGISANMSVGAPPPLFSSSVLSAAMVLGVLGFVLLRSRRRRNHFRLPRQQQRRAQ